MLPDRSATSACRAVVLKAAEKDARVGWVVGEEVGAEARESVVPAGKHFSLTGITIQENAPVTAYPQRIGITGGMHEDMHVRMSAVAYRVARQAVTRIAGLDVTAPYGGPVPTPIVTTPQVDYVFLCGIHGDREVIVTLRAWEHVGGISNPFPGATGLVETEDAKKGVVGIRDECVNETRIMRLHTQRDAPGIGRGESRPERSPLGAVGRVHHSLAPFGCEQVGSSMGERDQDF